MALIATPARSAPTLRGAALCLNARVAAARLCGSGGGIWQRAGG
jgi:hypothetical protein